MESLGERIVKLRKELNIRQQDIADAAGVNQSTIGRIENGKLSPSSDIIIIIANMLNVSCDYLLKGKNADMHFESTHDNLSDEDMTLVNLYHSLSSHDQNEIIGIMNLKLSSQKRDSSSTYQTTKNQIETA